MATTTGRCTNVDYCSLASSKRDIQVKIGDDFVCPECSKPLRAPPMEAGGGGRSGLLVGGGVAALLLIGGGLYAGYRLSGPAAPPAGMRAVAPEPPHAAPASQMASSAAPIAAPAAPATMPASSPEQTVLLRLDSAPAGASLAPKLASAYLASLGDTAVAEQAGDHAGETRVTGNRLGRPETVAITSATANAALAALDHGTTTIALAARPEAAGGMSVHDVALDAAAVLVNARNPLSSITLPQLRGVLDGSIARWSQLGGAGGPIHLVQSGDPTAEGLNALVPGAPPVPASAPRVADAAARVAADPDALALLPHTLVGRGKLLAVAAVGSRPALPTPSSVANDQYPLVRHIAFAVPTGGGNPIASRLLAFALSPEGQAVVAQAGYVPLHVALEAAPVAAAPAPATPKERYRALVTGATRLAADLHFEASSNKLDLHSAREVDRVWNFMMSDHTPPDHLVLLGFADNQGTPEANLALSQQRAQAVAAVFTRRGLPPGQVVAFGADLPVADNATEAGREKNRRVEVFLKN